MRTKIRGRFWALQHFSCSKTKPARRGRNNDESSTLVASQSSILDVTFNFVLRSTFNVSIGVNFNRAGCLCSPESWIGSSRCRRRLSKVNGYFVSWPSCGCRYINIFPIFCSSSKLLSNDAQNTGGLDRNRSLYEGAPNTLLINILRLEVIGLAVPQKLRPVPPAS